MVITKDNETIKKIAQKVYKRDFYDIWAENQFVKRIEDGTVFGVVGERENIFFVETIAGMQILASLKDISFDEVVFLRSEGYHYIVGVCNDKRFFKVCETSSVNPKATYCYDKYDNIYTLDKQESVDFRDNYEKFYFPKNKPITYKLFNGIEMKKHLNKNERNNFFGWTEGSGFYSYCGMHYFNTGHELFNEDIFWLCAMIDDVIIGCVNYGNWPGEGMVVSYIDVNWFYRRQGIMKKLIEKLNEYIPATESLRITRESSMGRQAKAFKHFQDTLNCHVYQADF